MTDHTQQGQPIPRSRPSDAHAYRFWFDRGLAKWCISPAEGTSLQVLMVDELRLCEVDVQCHSNGTATCTAELLADGRLSFH